MKNAEPEHGQYTKTQILDAIKSIQGAREDVQLGDSLHADMQMNVAISQLNLCLSSIEGSGFLAMDCRTAFYDGKIAGLERGRDIFTGPAPYETLEDQLGPSECNMTLSKGGVS